MARLIARRTLLFVFVLAMLGSALAWTLTHRASQDPSLHVVRIPLTRGVELRPVITRGKLTKSETFEEVVGRLKPYAAINGTFFDPELKPLGDIVCDGKRINRGHYPNAVAFTKSGEVVFVRRVGRRFDWNGYKSALAAGPRLIHKGKITLNMRADGFSEKGLTRRAPRSAVGITRDRELLLVVDTDYVTLGELAQSMLDLGAVEAMNLDGGPASGLYHDGKMLVSPVLRMTNVLTVVKRDH